MSFQDGSSRHLTDLPDMKRLFVLRHGKAERERHARRGTRADRPRRRRRPQTWELDRNQGRWHPIVGQPGHTNPSDHAKLCESWGETEDALHLQPDAYLASDEAWLTWIDQYC